MTLERVKDFQEDFELEETSLEDLIFERELKRDAGEGDLGWNGEDFWFPPGEPLKCI